MKTAKLAHSRLGWEDHWKVKFQCSHIIMAMLVSQPLFNELGLKMLLSLLQTLANLLSKKCWDFFLCNWSRRTKSSKWLLYTPNNKQLSSFSWQFFFIYTYLPFSFSLLFFFARYSPDCGEMLRWLKHIESGFSASSYIIADCHGFNAIHKIQCAKRFPYYFQ